VTRRDGNSIDEMTNGAIRVAPFGDDFAVEKGFFYSFNVRFEAKRRVTPIGRLYVLGIVPESGRTM